MRRPEWALLLLLCGGCDFYYHRIPSPDDLWQVIPWFDQMIHARYIRPYETDSVPRYTPEGSVPVTGSELDWSAEWISGKTISLQHFNKLTSTVTSGSIN